LRKGGTRGEVVLTLRLSPRGAVLDAVLESATVPAFGEAALAVARQWRFLPGVKDGQAVESQVSMPLVFNPP
jgi:TonB family protein